LLILCIALSLQGLRQARDLCLVFPQLKQVITNNPRLRVASWAVGKRYASSARDKQVNTRANKVEIRRARAASV
jgi:hypothetical protein